MSGSAHCRSSTASATGAVADEILQDIHDRLDDHPRPVDRAQDRGRPAGRTSADPQHLGDLGPASGGRAPSGAQRLDQRTKRPVLLDLVAGAAENPEPRPFREGQHLGQQPGLADPSLALDEHGPAPTPSRLPDDGAHGIQLR